MTFPSPTIPAAGRAEVFLGYLDYFRETALAKVSGPPASAQHSSRLPSGWTPLELLKHLRYVELRWISWGFEGNPTPAPWGDSREARRPPGHRRGALRRPGRRVICADAASGGGNGRSGGGPVRLGRGSRARADLSPRGHAPGRRRHRRRVGPSRPGRGGGLVGRGSGRPGLRRPASRRGRPRRPGIDPDS
ncbi:mycothiol transferase [Paractinoplanes toevensis]|uniref:mycothiol transferase n=1 Tax=Paractinoplanes toevensis TaxID=571911 RepID=UPI001BB3E953|nr:DUF664 domain-containing protein [Actinoplanes toevensis]